MGKAKKRLAEMRRSKTGWKASDLNALYTAYGFERLGGIHDKYCHPALPGQFGTVTRSSGEIHELYVRRAIELIDALERHEEVTDND